MIRIFLLCIDLKNSGSLCLPTVCYNQHQKMKDLDCLGVNSSRLFMRHDEKRPICLMCDLLNLIISFIVDIQTRIQLFLFFGNFFSIPLYIYLFIFSTDREILFARPLGDLLALTIRYDNKGKT